MPRPARVLICLAVLIALLGLGAEDPAAQEEERRRLLTVLLQQARPDGRSESERIAPEQVRRAFGKPRRIARQILYQRYLEQWSFDETVPLRLEFDFVAGQPPRRVRVVRLR